MFRLYYDENGRVICYTCEVLPGDNYIEIDRQTYAEGRPDLRIVNGEIRLDNDYCVIARLVESIDGIKCEPEDICILTDSVENKKWKVEINEFRNY
jgi:hypothetical protein